MSDSTDAGSPAPRLPEAVNLQNSVKERLVSAEQGASSVRERVVEALVEEELVRRTTVLSGALVKRKELESAFQKIKPDQTTVTEDGVEVSVFSKPKFQERKSAEEKLTKLDRLIDGVISTPSADAYRKLADFK